MLARVIDTGGSSTITFKLYHALKKNLKHTTGLEPKHKGKQSILKNQLAAKRYSFIII